MVDSINALSCQGSCPQCQIENKSVAMVRNLDACLECPRCRLQIRIDGLAGVILRERGNGEISITNQIDYISSINVILTRANRLNNSTSDGSYFYHPNELAGYLKTQTVATKPFYLKLILAFIRYKYEGESEQYLRLRRRYRIDLEDASISNKLIERDYAGEPVETSYAQLFSFFHLLIDRYHHNSLKGLPEMGMGVLQVEICKKHLATIQRELQGNELLQKKYFLRW